MLLLFVLACTDAAPGSDSGVVDDTAPGDDTESASDPVRLRVATWNVQSVGSEATSGYEALLAVLLRLDADLVGLNEVQDEELGRLAAVAEATGYEVAVGIDTSPFATNNNALLSRIPVREAGKWTSATLSGQSDANELTREPASVVVDLGEHELVVVVNHYKSGWDDDDEFRRSVDCIRTAQVYPQAEQLIVMGDLNDDLADAADEPAVWTSMPGGLPSSYWMAAELYDELYSTGLDNTAFGPLQERGLEALAAERLDGDMGTRPTSGRRLDYIWASEGLRELADLTPQVYSSEDEERAGGLDFAGEALDSWTSEVASDHLPVVVDIEL